MKTILDALQIEIVEVSNEKVMATMPVHDATRQPFGQLHGGFCGKCRHMESLR